MQGSGNVLINRSRALRVGDRGHCADGGWKATQGASTVLINDCPAHRVGDEDAHSSGASGKLVTGSANVLIGNNSPRNSRPRIRMKILLPEGEPFSNAGYVLADGHGNIVREGHLDDDGMLDVTDIEWKLYAVRLSNGWVIKG